MLDKLAAYNIPTPEACYRK